LKLVPDGVSKVCEKKKNNGVPLRIKKGGQANGRAHIGPGVSRVANSCRAPQKFSQTKKEPVHILLAKKNGGVARRQTEGKKTGISISRLKETRQLVVKPECLPAAFWGGVGTGINAKWVTICLGGGTMRGGRQTMSPRPRDVCEQS